MYKFFRIFFLYWHTIRYLKPIQVYYRVWIWFYRPIFIPLVQEYSLRKPVHNWVALFWSNQSNIEPFTFTFLNKTHTLPSVGGWDNQGLEKLWLYNLHYFNDLNFSNSLNHNQRHEKLISRWLKENPRGRGVGWESYPTSLRIVNWVKWLMAGNKPVDGMLDSLVIQANWLSQRLEWHLLGNHLFANAKALVFAAHFFNSSESTKWLRIGLDIIEKQLPEQVLPDGGHFERSTMYHSIFLEDVLDLLHLTRVYPSLVPNKVVDIFHDVSRKMLSWLHTMSHPDGEISFFNDATFGVAKKFKDLKSYATFLGISITLNQARDIVSNCELNESIEVKSLSDSGYISLSHGNGVALLDVAPVGPNYLPGHAHADTLSFELSVFGQRVVVNAGTSCYGVSQNRLLERSTKSHSTVEVFGENSSEVWGGFRVARRARPFNLSILCGVNNVVVTCSHDGYERLSKGIIHSRCWVMEPDALKVTDVVASKDCPDCSSVARYILHPNVNIYEGGAGLWTLILPDNRHLTVTVLVGRSYVDNANYAMGFGKIVGTKVLCVDLLKGEASLVWCWG